MLRVVAQRHIIGGAQPSITPKFELGRYFCTMHLSPKFHRPMFTRSEVIMLTNAQTHTHTQTNKQTDAAENIQLSSLPYDVG